MQSAIPQKTVPSTRRWLRPALLGISVGVWFLVLCFAPNPRPLSAPRLLIAKIQELSGYPEPVSQALASVSLRGAAFALLGVLTAASLRRVALRVALPLALVVAPALAVLSQWINSGYFPVAAQLQVSIASAVIGTLAGFALRRGRFAPVVLTAIVVGLVAIYLWATASHESADLKLVCRQTVQHVLTHADKIRSGNEGIADAVRLAFAYAEENSHQGDSMQANKAAILALGIIIGDDQIAKFSQIQLDPDWRGPIDALRGRVTLRNRADTPRHYWVSAALVITADESQAMTVGLGKELLDAEPGGSGFSFVDLAANRAGILLAVAATRDEASARATQLKIVQEQLQADDYCPKIEDLPEGLTQEQFQATYGGLGGELTRVLRNEIDRRMSAMPLLRFSR